MKKQLKIMAVLILSAVFIMTLIGCPNSSDAAADVGGGGGPTNNFVGKKLSTAIDGGLMRYYEFTADTINITETGTNHRSNANQYTIHRGPYITSGTTVTWETIDRTSASANFASTGSTFTSIPAPPTELVTHNTLTDTAWIADGTIYGATIRSYTKFTETEIIDVQAPVYNGTATAWDGYILKYIAQFGKDENGNVNPKKVMMRLADPIAVNSENVSPMDAVITFSNDNSYFEMIPLGFDPPPAAVKFTKASSNVLPIATTEATVLDLNGTWTSTAKYGLFPESSNTEVLVTEIEKYVFDIDAGSYTLTSQRTYSADTTAFPLYAETTRPTYTNITYSANGATVTATRQDTPEDVGDPLSFLFLNGSNNKTVIYKDYNIYTKP